MTKELESALLEWHFARKNTIAFINGLDEIGLKMKLPRPGLDTFCKHIEEMIDVQKCYLNAIDQGKISFNQCKDKYDGNSTKEDLLRQVVILDEKLNNMVANSDPSLEIDWGDEFKTLSSHLYALASHEIFHIGQWVSFCYSLDLRIPDEIVKNWALTSVS